MSNELYDDEEEYEITEEAFKVADAMIAKIATLTGHDYTAERITIANEFENVLWQGDWDTTIDFDDLPSLRFIQEDEYDQSMDEDEQPETDFLLHGHYVVIDD